MHPNPWRVEINNEISNHTQLLMTYHSRSKRTDGNILHTTRAWWRHQMETFSALLAICAENSPVPGEFSTQRPVTRSFDVYFDLRPNKGLSKQLWGWWFETQSCPLWRHRNVIMFDDCFNSCSFLLMLFFILCTAWDISAHFSIW